MTDSELPKDAQDKYIVPGLERGLLLLCEFTRSNRTLTAPELARRLALPRSTIFRLLTTLETMGFVTRSGNEYRLGMSVLRLGFEYLASLELTELGQPLLARLCDRVNYPSNLVVRDGRSIVYVAKVSPPSVFSSAVNVGTRLPAHATVLGASCSKTCRWANCASCFPKSIWNSTRPAHRKPRWSCSTWCRPTASAVLSAAKASLNRRSRPWPPRCATSPAGSSRRWG